MATEGKLAASDEDQPAHNGTSTSVQSRALSAVRETGRVVAGAKLLEATGPLAELAAADARGVLDDARRVLITKKGRGVIFEASTVVQLQEAGERYGISLTARLATTTNNPRADVFVRHSGADIELQLKCGTDKYIRAALRQQVDGVTVLVPADAAQAAAAGSLEFDGIELEIPTRDQLFAQTEQSLDRLSAGEPVVTFADAAKRALRDSLLDAVVVAVLDLAAQALEKPETPIDWRRTGMAVFKVTATTVVTSLLATANTVTAMKAAGRAIDLASVARGTRVAASLVPHALDVCIDLAKVSSGKMNRAQFVRSASGHAGAAAAEYLAFPLVARLAVRLGPIGGAIVMVAGGMLVAFLGRKTGEFLHDMAADLLADLPAGQQTVEGRVVEVVERLQQEGASEAERRAKKAEKRQCEEPRCSRPHHARGMCGKHYGRWWRRQRRFNWRAYSGLLPRPNVAISANVTRLKKKER